MSVTLWILTGPTASGKTEIGFNVAREMQGEIISADSMLIYQGMDIGTAKPPLSMRKEVPHHFIDIMPPWESYSVGKYVKDVEDVISNLCENEKNFLIVGGTPLYIKGIVSGIFDGPEANWDFREKFEKLAKKKGNSFVHNILQRIDPITAQRLHPNNLRRIIRAIEVYKETKKQMSLLHKERAESRNYNIKIVCITRKREDVYKRIEQRVDKMFEKGLVNEVKVLFDNPNSLSKQAKQALGYKEIIKHLEGECTLDEAKETIKLNTRRFSKRQMTWFRSFPNIYWMEVDEDEKIEGVSREISLKVLKEFKTEKI